MSKVEENIEKLITEPINKLGYEVYDVMYVKESKDNYRRIFIDSPNGISLEDCEKVNNEINDMLDEANYIKEPYFLEVSSPGVERHIRKDKHFESNMGEEILVKTFTKIQETNSKENIGILKSFDEDSVTLEIEDTEVVIEKRNIILIKRVFKW